MSWLTKQILGKTTRAILPGVAWCTLSAPDAFVQDIQTPSPKPAYAADPANVPDAVARVKAGDFGPVHLEMIAEGRAVEAVPALKAQFEHSHDALTRAQIASVLVRLGDRDDRYWDFLVDQATRTIDSNPPDFTAYDSEGKPVPGPPPEVVSWANEHHMSLDDAGQKLLFEMPGAITMLAMTGDSRDVPVLRRALSSRNPMIQVSAARGLALLKDEGSVPLIIEACQRAHPDSAGMIATWLVYFDAPEAQRAVDKYVPRETAIIYREQRAKGITPFR